MDSYKETFETWNKVAKIYQDQFMDMDLYNDTYDAFCDQIVNINAAILEIGCGPGNITKYLLSKRPDFKIEAIDISPKMIELAKVNNPTANFRVMDSRDISNITTKFDAVVCGFCIPYLSEADCTKLIRDCTGLLNDNGIIYLSFIEGDYKNSGYQTASSGDRVYFYYHSLNAINKELEENNFKTIEVSHKPYTRRDGTRETHIIVIAKLVDENLR